MSTDSSEFVILETTFPNKDLAKQVLHPFVEQGFVACVHIIDAVTSLYKWKGTVCEEPEVLCRLKTSKKQVAILADALAKHHPYDTPELIVLPISSVSKPYGKWMASCLNEA